MSVTNRIPRKENMSVKELKEFMNLHGISEKELALILGVSIQAVTLWIKGERTFTVTNTRLIRMFMKYPQLIREF